MSTEVPKKLTSALNGAATDAVERPSAGYHPSVWGDSFVVSNLGSEVTSERRKNRMVELKMEVKMMLAHADDDLHKETLLNLIDQIQCLGIGYLFEREIDESLEHILDWYIATWDCGDSSHGLHITALVFRLLRQQGFKISCNVFDKFKDSTGKFSPSLAKDVRGLLSLYEASHLSVHGEDILEEALAFTVHHLRQLAVEDDDLKLSPTLVAEVKQALEWSLRKGLVRIHAWHHIQIYEEAASRNEVILELAKLDFNRLQELHQKELCEITRWWKDRLDVERNFPYARDRATECYFWILGVYFEPEFALARMILTKVIAFTSVLDDTYDVYGTPEELQLLTDAIDRWDISAASELPEYMQIFYKVLLDTYCEFEEKLAEKGTAYRAFYAKEAMKSQARSYFNEAKWFHENYIPTLEEYIPLALETSGHKMLAITSFVGMGDVASKDAFEWLNSDPKILRGSQMVGRLMNDIVSHEHEQKRGHVASAVECYMKHQGITEQEAEKEIWRMVNDAWKDINEECLRPTPAPVPLLVRILNLTRVIHLVYKGKDWYTHSQYEMKDYVAALLINPIPV